MSLLVPEPVQLADGKNTGVRTLPTTPSESPILLYLHGGGGTYTEGIRGRIPQLPFAASLGIPGYSVNRPDYLDSASLGLPSDEDSGFFAASAEVLYEAAQDIWDRHRDTAPGIVLQGCSIGSAVALKLAELWATRNEEGKASWPLLGLILADVGTTMRPGVAETLGAAAPTEQLEDAKNTTVGSLDFGPDWARDNLGPDEPLTVPRAETIELAGGWLRSAGSVLRTIPVPTMWRIGALDPLWKSDPESLEKIWSALTVSSPYVNLAAVPGAAHPVFESSQGHAYTLETLAFIERCRVMNEIPQVLAAYRSEFD